MENELKITDKTALNKPVVKKSVCVHPDDYYRKNKDGGEWCSLCGEEI